MNQEITKTLKTIESKLPLYDIPQTISSVEENATALDLAAKIKKAGKLIEEKMDFYAKPHYNEYKRIRDAFKPYLDMLGEKEKSLKALMLEFHKAEQKRLDEEQKKLEEEALKNAKAGEAVEVAVVNDIKTREAIHGKSTVRQVKKWRVVNLSLVPREYLMVDDAKVKAALKKGKVPEGIEEYIEESMSIAT